MFIDGSTQKQYFLLFFEDINCINYVISVETNKKVALKWPRLHVVSVQNKQESSVEVAFIACHECQEFNLQCDFSSWLFVTFKALVLVVIVFMLRGSRIYVTPWCNCHLYL